MSNATIFRLGILALLLAIVGLRSAAVKSDAVYLYGTPANIAQVPLYLKDAVPPLNMLVMGKDHKIYYEAYNDASDLNGDGSIDVGYRGWELKSPAPTDGSSRYKIDYYGYFNSYVCYSYDGSKFTPRSAAPNKTCSGYWSGDFLNYLTTSRMDALRRVLYGGWRQVDTTASTVLQGAFFPQDAHSWGKEYRSTARDGYDVGDYAPLSQPSSGRYHLFAVTTLTGNGNTFPGYQAPVFRVLKDAPYRVWNWLSIEGPVAGLNCFNASNQRVACVSGGSAQPFPGHPGSRAAFDNLVNNYAIPAYRYGSAAANTINCSSSDCNPFGPDDNYLAIFEGQITIPAGRYQFRVDGDDVIDFQLRRSNGNIVAEAGCYTTAGRGFGTCSNAEKTPVVDYGSDTYNFTFRQEEGSGGDGYRLQYRSCTGMGEGSCANVWSDVFAFNGVAGIRNTTLTTYNLTPTIGGTTRDDYNVRVETCTADAALRDATCKAYVNGGNTVYKPTGILHDYGENQKMYFGLITGSQRNNLQGGVLRRNVADFASEIDPDTGIFRSNVNGIVNTISRLRMIGGGYNSGTDNSNSDSNWNWANGTGNCASQGDRPLNNGECRMWGNPLAEMLYESMRYFAGAGDTALPGNGATPRFATGGGGEGATEETTMGLGTEAWRDPYAVNGGFRQCAKPYQTIISDINPSYDSDLPGNRFGSTALPDGGTPGSITGFNAGNEGDAIWAAEGYGGSQNVFVGDVGGVTDGAPTAKNASTFGNIRGLSPEEPSKQGSFYSASVARFARNHDVNARVDNQFVSTYSIALASPLPRIEFTTRRGGAVTLIPFAKTASGTFGGATRKPTNTIVDFYVEQLFNLPGGVSSPLVNEGRAYAVFRINYEDVEQGNDHDMDAIVRYEVAENGDGTVTVTLRSEYAAGSADQNIGYVISGTTRDGIYLEVRDADGPGNPYILNTPPGAVAGQCTAGITTFPCNQNLPLNATRTFTLSSGTSAIQLKDPLWYAAKYGAPVLGELTPSGDPVNYFLVTNPLNLRNQLAKAFDDIANRSLDVGATAVSGARVGNSSFTLAPVFKRGRNGKDWTGNLTAVAVNRDGTLGSTLWDAQLSLPAPGSRNIRTITTPGNNATRVAAEFRDTNLSLTQLGIASGTIPTVYGGTYTLTDFVNYLRGDQSREASGGAGNTLRVRTATLGDIVNSEPVIASPRSNFGYGYYSGAMFSGYTGAGGYLATKLSRKTMAYVGANDGMLHAFDASTRPCPPPDAAKTCAETDAGRELFAFVPHGVLNRMGELPKPDNNFTHRYYVDGQIAVGDAKDGSTWKTLLAASVGGGGRSVFALDVSNPAAVGDAQVLWERNGAVDNDVGSVYGKPLIVPLENGSWGVLFGNGYGGRRNDPSLYILDAFTGSTIQKLTGDDGDRGSILATGLPCGAVGIFDQLCTGRSGAPYNGLGQITAIDRDGDGKVDTVYGGDLQGHLWKFDLSDANAANWRVANGQKALFRTQLTQNASAQDQYQPITGGIRVSSGPGTGVMVYFGTGRYFATGDNDLASPPQLQSFYGFFDNFDETAPTSTRTVANLQAQQVASQTTNANGFITRNISTTPVFYYGASAKRGWYLDLKVVAAANGAGERFIATPLIQSGRVFFTTFTPDRDGCDPGGLNFQYALDLLSGTGTLANVKVLGTGQVACTDGACGGAAITGRSGETSLAPVTGTGVAAINPIQKINPACDPSVSSCATFEECQVVIYPGQFVLPRPCGRQSWRQLK